ncbi:MAG TPA: ribosome silencing factor [Pyrinomonadaceae bacterium]
MGETEAAAADASAAEGRAAEQAQGAGQADEGFDERMLAALHAASEKKALELVALDLREVASFTDFFLLATGTNARQVQAISDAVEEQLKQRGTRPLRIEGYKTAEWVLLDYGDFIFHVFEDKARRFYDLERLWRDASRVALPAQLAADAGGTGGAEDSSLRSEK